MDADLLAEVRTHVGARGLSSFVATALEHELARVRLRELLDELTDELGAPDEAMVADAMTRLTGLTTTAVPDQRSE